MAIDAQFGLCQVCTKTNVLLGILIDKKNLKLFRGS